MSLVQQGSSHGYAQLSAGHSSRRTSIGGTGQDLERDSPLMGRFPEFNFRTVAGIVSAIEEQTACSVDDKEITGEIFETVGTLADFIESKPA